MTPSGVVLPGVVLSGIALATGAAVRVGAAAGGALLRAPRVHSTSAGHGPAVLLLNGICASGRVWPGAMTHLESEHRLIRVDARGTGRSRTRLPLTPAFTIADLADDAARCLREHGVDRATVIGWSMGGMVAQELALRHPAAVERLVLIATVPPVPASTLPIARMAAMALRITARAATGGWHRELAALAGPGFAHEHPEVLREFAQQLGSGGLAWWASTLQSAAIGTWRGPRRLRRIDVPTVILHGACDPVVPAANAHALATLIPGASCEVLDGVGHLVPYEAPQRLAAVLAR